MKRKFRKARLGFGRKDDNLRAIFASQTIQTNFKKYLEDRTDELLGRSRKC